jgi:hypothetical protein
LLTADISITSKCQGTLTLGRVNVAEILIIE